MPSLTRTVIGAPGDTPVAPPAGVVEVTVGAVVSAPVVA
jgi:hypothetical protein